MNAAEISRRMASQAESIAAHLLPQGRRKGAEWKAGSVNGEEGDSLSVRLTGSKAGVWKDFASGEGGDLLDLWAACRGTGLAEALTEAQQYLGVRKQSVGAPAPKQYRRPDRPTCQTPKAGALAWLTGRGLTRETLAAFKIGEQLRDGKTFAVFPFFTPDGATLVNVKYRNTDDKRDMRQEAGAAPTLFGWHLIDPRARTVAITEGEIDAMTLHQAGIQALSVNQGAGNHQWIEHDWEQLERFSDILVCFDNDEAGDKGAEEVMRRLGLERCRRMRTGAKDANQWLQDGADAAAFKRCVGAARALDPEELKSADEYTGDVEALFYPPPGSPRDPRLKIDVLVDWFEFRGGEYTCWTGINGHGKSLMLDQILLGLMEQGQLVVIFSGEMPPAKHLKRIHKQATGLDRPTREYVHAVGAWLRDKCWMFDLVGSAKLDRLLEVFGYAARRYGARHFVIDSLMMIDVPSDGPGAITKQNEAIQKITGFAKKYDAHLHLVAHPRKLRDEIAPPGKMDVAGAGGIVNGADNVFSIWRAQKDEAPPSSDPEDIEAWQKQQTDIDAKLILRKQRYGDPQDYTLCLWFDKASVQYRSQPRRYPLSYVPYSSQEPDHE
jgi:twinkle protein